MITPKNTSYEYGTFRTPEKEAADKANNDRCKAIPCPIVEAQSSAQLSYAQSTFATYQQYFHAWGLRAEDVESFCQTRLGKSPKSWLDNRPKKWGEGTLQVALEKEIAILKREAAIAPLSDEQCKIMARRF